MPHAVFGCSIIWRDADEHKNTREERQLCPNSNFRNGCTRNLIIMAPGEAIYGSRCHHSSYSEFFRIYISQRNGFSVLKKTKLVFYRSY